MPVGFSCYGRIGALAHWQRARAHLAQDHLTDSARYQRVASPAQAASRFPAPLHPVPHETSGLAIIARVKPESTSANDIPPLGIIMLDTQFARPLGDAGNPASWPFPVIIERVPKAYANDVVTGKFQSEKEFNSIAHSLSAQGCKSIISTCGFLARLPLESCFVAGSVVCVSTLLHFARLARDLPQGKRIAILTIDANSIDATIRTNCAIPIDTIIVSPPRSGHFCGAILDAREPLDVARAERELVETATDAQRAHPDIGLWLFECANMPPYRAAVERATGVRVYDALHMGIELHAKAMVRGGDSLTRPSGTLSHGERGVRE